MASDNRGRIPVQIGPVEKTGFDPAPAHFSVLPRNVGMEIAPELLSQTPLLYSGTTAMRHTARPSAPSPGVRTAESLPTPARIAPCEAAFESWSGG